MSRSLQVAFSLLISGAALWYSLHDVELGRLAADVARARAVWIGPMLVLAAVTLWLRALRWRVLLGTLGPLGETPVFRATCIGFMGNMVLPLRAGEAIKPLIVARSGRVSAPAALATVALERLCDMLMLGGFAIATLVLVPAAHELRERTPTVLIVVAIALLALAGVFRFAWWLEERLERVSGWLPPGVGRIVREGGTGFLRGVRGMGDLRTFALTVGLSALVWITTVAGFVAGALALEIDAPLLPLGLAVTVIVAAAVSVPSAPGFIGVFWAGSEIALGLFSVPKSTGFSFGILTWLVQMVVICGFGVWALSSLHLSLRDVRGAAAEESAPVAAGAPGAEAPSDSETAK